MYLAFIFNIGFYSGKDGVISEVYLVAVTARLIMLENAYAGFALIKLLGKKRKIYII